MSRVKPFSALEILLCRDCIPRAGLHNPWVCSSSISSTAAHGQPAHTHCDRINFLSLDLLKTTYKCTTLVKPSTSCSLIVHQGSLTLSDFIIRLKLISIPGLSFIVVNVICNWWRSCHWEMWSKQGWPSAGFDVGLNGTMAVLVSFCMASSSSYCFGLNFELLTFIY